MPYVKLDADGVERWYVGDRNFGSLGGNVIRADKNKLLGRLAFPKLEQAHPGGHVIKDRLQAWRDTPVSTLVSVAGTRWTIESCFEAAKSEVGLDQYELHTWTA